MCLWIGRRYEPIFDALQQCVMLLTEAESQMIIMLNNVKLDNITNISI